jgi:molybdate transport system substrate-binding protein
VTKFATQVDVFDHNRSRRSRSPRVSHVKPGFVVKCRSVGVALLMIAGIGLSACAANGANRHATVKVVTVFAAASLRAAFAEIRHRYQDENPGSTIEFNFAGSSDLVTQLTQGAKADVFASADTRNMDKAAGAGLLAANPVAFASNTLVIVAAAGNPKHITTLADLARPSLAVVVCAPPVPCGGATQKVVGQSGVRLNPVSEEMSVTDVLNKVTSGQADAGLVYRTDASSAGSKVATVEFPEAAGAVNSYPIAVLKTAADAAAARRFVELVTGEIGQKILRQTGFAKP